MRCERDPRERRGRQGPREVRVLAAVEGRPGRHAGRRAHLQAEDRRVLGAVADAGHRRRGAPRRLRRRHMDSPRLRGADSLQRRVRAVVAPCPLGDEARLAVAALPYRPARHGRDGRRQRLRRGCFRGMAPLKGAEMYVSCVLPGQALHDVPPETAGGHRALRLGMRSAARSGPRAGAAVVRAVRRMVRVLVGLPRGAQRRRRPHVVHPREAAQGKAQPRLAAELRDAVRLPRPEPGSRGPAAGDEQPYRGCRQRPDTRHAPQPPRALDAQAREGGLLVVRHARGMPEGHGADSARDAHRRRRRAAPLRVRHRRGIDREAGEMGRGACLGGASFRDAVPIRYRLARHTFCPITPFLFGFNAMPRSVIFSSVGVWELGCSSSL